jgi:hypothetical protein
MLVKKIMTAEDLKEEFIKFDRDYYSLEACQRIIEYFDEWEEPTELDIIALCCEFTEASAEEICKDYSFTFSTDGRNGLTWEELMEDEYERDHRDEWIDEGIMEKLNYESFAWRLENGNILYINY